MEVLSVALRQIEQQHFRRLLSFDPNLALLAHRRAVARCERLPVERHLTARHLHPGVAAGSQGVRGGLAGLQAETGEALGVASDNMPLRPPPSPVGFPAAAWYPI